MTDLYPIRQAEEWWQVAADLPSDYDHGDLPMSDCEIAYYGDDPELATAEK